MQIQCIECKNDLTLDSDNLKQGRWFECSYCGVTMEVKGVNKDGALNLIAVEEEK